MQSTKPILTQVYDFIWRHLATMNKLLASQKINSKLSFQPCDCLLNRLFRGRPKKTSKLHVTGLCEENSPVTGEFPTQRPVTRKMFLFDDVIIILTKPGSINLNDDKKACSLSNTIHNSTPALTPFIHIVTHTCVCMSRVKYHVQYIPRNMHTVFALLCFVVVIHWLIFPYPSGLLHWHCGNLTIAPVPAKQPWWIWINTSCEFIMNDCITTTKQSTKNRVHISWDILYHGIMISRFYFVIMNIQTAGVLCRTEPYFHQHNAGNIKISRCGHQLCKF